MSHCFILTTAYNTVHTIHPRQQQYHQPIDNQYDDNNDDSINQKIAKKSSASTIESMQAKSDHSPSEVQAIATELKKMDETRETRGVSKSTLELAKALKVYAFLHDGQMPTTRFKVVPKDTDWPSEFQSGYNLGSRLNEWRNKYNSKEMRPEDIEFFEEHDVQWRSEIKRDGTWISELARALRAYHLVFPDSQMIERKDLFEGYKLGEKVNQARNVRHKNYLTLEQFNMLENAGMQWGNRKYPPFS